MLLFISVTKHWTETTPGREGLFSPEDYSMVVGAPGTWEEHHGSGSMQRVKKQAVHLRSERKQREKNGQNEINLRTRP